MAKIDARVMGRLAGLLNSGVQQAGIHTQNAQAWFMLDPALAAKHYRMAKISLREALLELEKAEAELNLLEEIESVADES
jgi:hypothetical protein